MSDLPGEEIVIIMGDGETTVTEFAVGGVVLPLDMITKWDVHYSSDPWQTVTVEFVGKVVVVP